MSVRLSHFRKAGRFLRLRPGSILVLLRCLGHNLSVDLFTLAGVRHVRCNLCGWRGARFAAYPDGMKIKYDQRCPRCESSPRYRLFARYLESQPEFHERTTVLLEFAPEPSFQAWLHRCFGGVYLTADLHSPIAAMRTDLTRLGLRSSSIDVVICSHVLEHVRDDSAGLKEIRRILRPAGWCILLVPWAPGQPVTLEYGQPNPLEHDHFRRYGADFPTRVTAAGFDLIRVQAAGFVMKEEMQELGLRDGEILRGQPRSEAGPRITDR